MFASSSTQMNTLLFLLLVLAMLWFLSRLFGFQLGCASCSGSCECGCIGGCKCGAGCGCSCRRALGFPDLYTQPCDASRIAGYNLPAGWNRMCSSLREGFQPLEESQRSCTAPSTGGCQAQPTCADCERPFTGYDTRHREIFLIYWQEWKM